jgi:hypothetical protein
MCQRLPINVSLLLKRCRCLPGDMGGYGARHWWQIRLAFLAFYCAKRAVPAVAKLLSTSLGKKATGSMAMKRGTRSRVPARRASLVHDRPLHR